MPRLPVLEIIIAANVFVWRERRDFFSLTFPAIAVLAFWVTLGGWFAGGTDAEALARAPAGAVAAALFVAIAFFWVVFAVAWHRRYLLPAESTTVREALRWGRRQTRFLLRAIAVYALLLLAWLALVLVGSVGGAAAGAAGAGAVLPLIVVSLVAGLYGFARLALLFPATALDELLTFVDCWALTRGNGWRLVAIILLVAVPVTLVGAVIGYLVMAVASAAAGPGNLTVSFVRALVDQTLGFIGIAVGVSALSIAYEKLRFRARPGGPAVDDG